MSSYGPSYAAKKASWGGGYQPAKARDERVKSRKERLSKKKKVSANTGPTIRLVGKRENRFPVYSQAPKLQPVRKERTRAAPQAQTRRNPNLASSLARPKLKPQATPPRAGAWKSRKQSDFPVVRTPFKVFYDRGDIPVCIGHGARRRVQWTCDIKTLDYHHFLPLFVEGIRETKEPYTFLAFAGVKDLLDHGGDKILPVIPQLILPLKEALNTKNPKTIVKVLQVIQHLVKSAQFVGEALVPYYRQLLSVCNLVLLLESRPNLGDRIDYSQRKKENLIDQVNETLELLEVTGGPDAYVNIKYMIPTYESSISA